MHVGCVCARHSWIRSEHDIDRAMVLVEGRLVEAVSMRWAAGTHSVSLAPTEVRASATAAACAAESRTQSAALRQLTTSRLPNTEAAAEATSSLGCESVAVSGAAFSVLTLHRTPKPSLNPPGVDSSCLLLQLPIAF